MALRLLHTADWQIGRMFGQFEADDAAALFEARFQAVERLAALATQHAVDAVLVAGDVFDAQTVADKTIRRLFHAMQGYAGPWVLLPGNHDAALAESVWRRAQRIAAIPPNALCCLEPRPLLVAGCALLPAPLVQRHTYEDLTAWFDTAATPGGLPRIGLAHGCVQGILPEEVDSANPLAADRAAQARLDYLALGDWHGTRSIDARTWYAGTPETDRFRANASGQALLVSLAGPGAVPHVETLPSGRYCWQLQEQRLALPSDVDEVLQQLARWGAQDVVQLRLSGTGDLDAHRRLQRAVDDTRARVRALACDISALQLEPTAEDIAALHADGYVGEVIEDLRAAQAGPHGERARAALVILAALLDARGGQGGAVA